MVHVKIPFFSPPFSKRNCFIFFGPRKDKITVPLSYYVQMVPNLQWFDLQFSDFTRVRKQYAFSRNHISTFEFWSFPSPAICGKILLWCWLATVTCSNRSIIATWSQGWTTYTLTAILCPDNHSVFHFQYSNQWIQIAWDIQHFTIKYALC